MVEEMINNIYDFFNNKKILILGYGREGKSTYSFIRNRFKDLKLTILDYNIIEDINDDNAKLICDDEYEKYFEDFDVIIKSPGVSIKRDVYERNEEKIVSQTGLFLKYTENNVIGITGTKGKSTTSSLVYHILKENNVNSILLGNIGTPIFSEIDNIKDNTVVVIEMSSHQIQYVKNSPHIAVLLNIYQEHLDYYENFSEYIIAKESIFKFQKENDILIYNACCENIDNNKIERMIQEKVPIYINSNVSNNVDNFVKMDSDKVYFSIFDKKLEIEKKDIVTSLLGDHNLYNVCVSIAVCLELGLDIKDILKSVESFKGLEHRMEFVGKYDEIYFYNDSIATIPEATICNIQSFKKVNTIIIGGKDRGIDYSNLVNYLCDANIDNILFIGESGKKIYEMLNSSDSKFIYADNLENAVKIAKEKTSKNGICVLSPASASYGYYKNFEERGNIFKKLVKGE